MFCIANMAVILLQWSHPIGMLELQTLFRLRFLQPFTRTETASGRLDLRQHQDLIKHRNYKLTNI